MTVKLPRPPLQYDPVAESQRNLLIEQELDRTHKRQQDMELVSGARLILRSPDGTRWSITVNNSGTISATSI